MSTTKTPPMEEFIDLAQRRQEARKASGYKAMENRVTVAVYNTAKGTQTLTVRISEDLAERYGLIEGARLTCLIHPDQRHIALAPGHGTGAALFRQRKGRAEGRAMIYQTTLRQGTLEAQPATAATMMEEVDSALVITL